MFPVLLNLDSKRVVIFGGGEVATRRSAKFLRSGAKVQVISREFNKGLKDLKGDIELVEDHITDEKIDEHLKGAFFVVAATDDGDLNARIEEEGRRKGILVNRADSPSDVLLPAVIDEGSIIISIATSGKSPALAKAIKKRIKKILTPEDIVQLELQEYLRAMLKNMELEQKERENILKEVMFMPEILEHIRKGELSRAREAARRFVDAHH